MKKFHSATNKIQEETTERNQIRIDKDGFKPHSRFDWKIVAIFEGGHELNCNELVDMN